VIGVGLGFFALWSYASKPGAGTHASTRWPTESRLAHAAGRPSLLVFVHPRCSCSRATLTELGHTLARARGQADPTVIFVRPHGAPADWDATDLKPMAARLPGVTLFDDTDGIEARRFGAVTSGAALLYGSDGALAFAGGLTSVRGHQGDSFGQERLVALLHGEKADRADSPVFGCPLDDDHEAKERP